MIDIEGRGVEGKYVIPWEGEEIWMPFMSPNSGKKIPWTSSFFQLPTDSWGKERLSILRWLGNIRTRNRTFKVRANLCYCTTDTESFNQSINKLRSYLLHKVVHSIQHEKIPQNRPNKSHSIESKLTPANPNPNHNLWCFDPKTIPSLGYTKVMPYTKFEYFGSICFWVIVWIHRRTEADDHYTTMTTVDISKSGGTAN